METRDALNYQKKDHLDTSKTVRLVEYLLQLATLRTKTIREITEYEKILWFSDIPHQQGCFIQAWGRDEEYQSDKWLEIKSEREPELPAVPEQCEEWVNFSSLRIKDEPPKLLPKITRLIPNPNWQEESDEPKIISYTESLADHPEVQGDWDRYVERKWFPWTEEHNAWSKVYKIYSALFSIYQEQLRLGEEYELVLGLGLLTWQTPTRQHVRRHLIVADAILEFEARLSKFTVRPHTEGAKLRPELDMLDIAQQPTGAEEEAKNSLALAEDDPWKKDCIENALQTLVHSIDSRGNYNDSLEAKTIRTSEKPIVEYAPALILRKRSNKGLTETLKRIKEQIEDGAAVPIEFADLAEAQPENNQERFDTSEETNTIFDGEVFFPKPSNEEQRRIVDKIRASNGVLVQGPPGTGKSHTIANLICHLLATGQRTLITAKTPRALQVLEELIPEELRPLCINLLGSGLKDRQSLESSVAGILRKTEDWNEDNAKSERTKLEKHLRSLREEKVQIERQLRSIRESETYPQSIAEGTYQGTAARIAEAVNRDRVDYEWFTDVATLNKTCPVTAHDLRRALDGLRQFTPKKHQELDLKWPEAMPSSESFNSLVKDEKNAIEEVQKAAHGADNQLTDLLSEHSISDIEAIRDVLLVFRNTYRKLLTSSHSWMDEALRDILSGNLHLWRERLRVTQDVITSIEELVQAADDTPIELPEDGDINLLHKDALGLKEHLEGGGKLGWGVFRPKDVKKRVYIIKEVKIDGRPCSTAEHFSILADVLRVRIESEKAWEFWNGKSNKSEGPYALQLVTFKSLKDALADALKLETIIANCRKAISRCPRMNEPIWANESQVESIIASCRLTLSRIHKQHVIEKIKNIEEPISRIVSNSDTHPVTLNLLNAIYSRNTDEFLRYASAIHELEEQRQHCQEIDEHLSELRNLIPQLITSLKQTYNESYWEERIQHINEAWHWAQARYWIEDYIQQEDVPALAKRAKQIEDEINSTIAKLASLHAWSFCFSRLTTGHRRNMRAWQQTVNKITKSGRGKQDFFHRREAQKNLDNCREAIPAWIMPLHRVWDTVSPQPEMFDVIIVDEASQCGFESLPLFYMAKKVLVVGDDKQISPEAVAIELDNVTKLINQYLYDFEHKASFNIDRSLFDHAELRYNSGHVVLREHFRCMPEIIKFSNDLCYSNAPLIPLRQYGPNRLPPLEHVFVNNGYREGSGSQVINQPEAKAIVERIIEMCGDNRYNGKSMGVVVLQGKAQVDLIWEQLREQLNPEEIENRRLICGDPYSFQGDERDIMFISMVTASNARIGSLTKPADERRFNVAASRARDMMILFHSVTTNDLSSLCLRKRLLDFFEDTKPPQIDGIDREELEYRAIRDNRGIVKPPDPFDSWFEVDVALELLRKNFAVLPQYKFAGKRIDLVVEGGQARLAIECDGDNWHGADQYEKDMQRQRQLERCGWQFFRVRESAFYANKENSLSGLWQMLEEREIYPVGINSAASDHEMDEPSAQKTDTDHLEPTEKIDGN